MVKGVATSIITIAILMSSLVACGGSEINQVDGGPQSASNDLDSESTTTDAEPESTTTDAEPESTTTDAEPESITTDADPETKDIEAPDLTIMSKHPTITCLNGVFDKFVNVFGMYVMGTPEAPESFVNHSAGVLAQYLDNDEDGNVDNQKVLDFLVEANRVVPLWSQSDSESFYEETNGGALCEERVSFGASMFLDDKWALGGIKAAGDWDTNLEEIWHIITWGWDHAYPVDFGVMRGNSQIGEAMDAARGGQLQNPPETYPEEAWYKYYDPTCEYACQIYEYFYWILMANIGALDPQYTDKCESSKDEWHICTKEELQQIDPKAYDLLNNQGFELPTQIPNGLYRGIVPVGDNPVAMTFDGSHLWVIDYYSADESLVKIDPNKGTISDVFPIGSRLIALGFDGQSIWVANRENNSAMKIDTQSGQILKEIDLGNEPSDMVFDGENIWVSVSDPRSGDSLIKINPSTNQITGTIETDRNLSGMVFDGRNMWVANASDNTVLKVDTSRDVITAIVYVGGGPTHLTFDGTNIWVTNYDDDTISKVDPTSHKVIDVIQVGNGPTEIAFDGNSIWVVYLEDQTVSRINPKTNEIIKVASLNGFTNAMVFDGNNMWVSNGPEKGTVVKLISNESLGEISRPNSDQLDTEELAIDLNAQTECSETLVSDCVAAIINTGKNPSDIAFDGQNIWVLDNGLIGNNGPTITKINPDTNEILFTDELEGSPSDVIYDGLNIWIGGSILHKVNPSSNIVDVVATEVGNLVFDGEHIWGVKGWHGQELVKINSVTGSVLSTLDVGMDLYGIASNGNYLWVSQPFDDSITKIDIADNKVVDTFPIKIDKPGKVYDWVSNTVFDYPYYEETRPWEVKFDGRYLWVAHLNNASISKIDITNNQVLASISIGDYPQDIEFDGSYIWVVNCVCNGVGESIPGNILKIDPSIDRVVAIITLGRSPEDLVFDGSHLWVANQYDDSISKVIP